MSKKSQLEHLQDLAKGEIATTSGGQVNMSSPSSVRQGQTMARLRATKIRTNSPTAALPKSMNKCKEGEEDAKKSSRPPGAPHSFSSGQRKRGFEKPPHRLNRKASVHRKAGHFRNPLNYTHKGTQPFDMEAFNRENPVLEVGENEPLKPTTFKPAKVRTNAKPDMERQENKMKSAKTKKSFSGALPTIHATDCECCKKKVVKGLDASLLPKLGSVSREKYEENYRNWKPKEKPPKNYQALDEATKEKLNAFAAVGHKESMHALMDDWAWSHPKK